MGFNKFVDAFLMGFLVFLAAVIAVALSMMVVSFAIEFGLAATIIAGLAFIVFFAIIIFIGYLINERL